MLKAKFNKKNKEGRAKAFTLVEVIIYAALLGLLITTITTSILQVAQISAQTKVWRSLREGAISSLDRMAHEIRKAYNVDDSLSAFDANPGILLLMTTDDLGNRKNVAFRVNGTALEFIDYGISMGNLLSPGDVVVDNLIFRKIETSRGIAIKIELTLSGIDPKNPSTQKFYDTVVMRGSY